MALVNISVELPPFDYSEQLQKRMDSVYRNAGQRLARCIRRHMRHLAETRHGSSNALGAKPSNHFKATDVLDPVVSNDGVEVAVTTPGISRAYHDIDIYPKEANALAIPLHATAYGIQPREINDRGLYDLFRIKHSDGTKGNVLYREEGGELIPMYALTKHVHQVKDPSLMPTNKQMTDEAIEGALAAIKQILGT